MTNSVTGLRRSSEAFPKTKLAPQNVMVIVWWSTAGLIHYSFLNPSETITSEKYAQQIDEMYGCLNSYLTSYISDLKSELEFVFRSYTLPTSPSPGLLSAPGTSQHKGVLRVNVYRVLTKCWAQS